MQMLEFLNQAWLRYVQLTPDAPLIHQLLKGKSEPIINDHIAFRTFNLKGISRLELGEVFEAWGYQAQEDLDFPEKRLKATYYLHSDPKLPKIFISELLVERFSKELQDWVRNLGAQAHSKNKALQPSFFLERTWNPIRFEDYQRFYPESEYAAWTAAFGIQVNHFTILVNSLTPFKSLEELNHFLVAHGITLNSSGGTLKGSPAQGLEQSSTLAKKIEWEFEGGEKKSIMGCYYEFAKRYPLPGSTRLYPGFIPESANKIFESTFEKN